MDVDRLVEHFGSYLQTTIGLRSVTVQTYIRHLACFATLPDIDVGTYIFERVPASSQRHAMSALRHAKEFLAVRECDEKLRARVDTVQDGVIRRRLRNNELLRNLTTKPDRPTTPVEEFNRLWDLAKMGGRGCERANQCLRPALILGLLCGLRRGDILAATWDWIDWDEMTITIVDPKGGRPYQVPLTEVAAKQLAYLQFARAEENSPRHIVQNPKRIHSKTNRTTLTKELALLGLKPHALRRGFATTMLKNGAPLPIVAKLMNHKSPETTFKSYCNPSKEDLRDALSFLE
jgi:integrase